MSTYVFIESRDPFASRDAAFVGDTAISLQQLGHDVIVFFVQNGVFAVRTKAAGAAGGRLAELAEAGVRLLADDFSLDERGIKPAEMEPAIHRSSIDALVTCMIQEDTKAIWH